MCVREEMEKVDLRVGCYQCTTSLGTNITEIIQLIENIVHTNQSLQLDLILFPELFLPTYDCGVDNLRNYALDIHSPEIQYICMNICSKYHISLCFGYSEKEDHQHPSNNLKNDENENENTRRYNSAILIDSSGKIILNYRKTHLWDPSHTYEKSVFTHGNDLPIANLFIPRTNQEITIGILICFDIEFPEPARILRLAGASVLLVPTAVVDTLPAQCMVPTRAGENLFFIVYSNFTGPCLSSSDNHSFCGLSGIFGPDGREIVRAKSDEIGLFTGHLIGANYTEYVIRNNYFLERKNKCHLYTSILNNPEG